MTTAVLLALFASALALGAPLLLAALGEIVGERSGVLNIGLEGMMLCGAWAGAAAGFAAHNAAIGLVAAMAAGAALAAIFALLVVTLPAEPIVVGTGLNLFALGVTGTLHRAFATRFGDYRAQSLPPWFFIGAGMVSGVLLWWFLRATQSGLRLRATGENALAAQSAGVHVARTRWMATLFNGAACGAAGAFLSMSHTDSFAENISAGRGFIALTIVILGRWNPLGAIGAALLFGAAEGSQFVLQSRLPDQYYPLLLALPYALTLLALGAQKQTANLR